MAPQHFARRVQAIGIAVTAVWSAVCTYLLVKLLDHTVGARVSLEEERKGLELAIAAE
jgi:Amt family ammonium transporter